MKKVETTPQSNANDAPQTDNPLFVTQTSRDPKTGNLITGQEPTPVPGDEKEN